MSTSTPRDVVATALASAEKLCARATAHGGLTTPASAGEVALELRDLFPLVDDAVIDRHVAAVVRAAGHVSTVEAADACDAESYADAAWEAGLDPADVGHLDGSGEELDGCAQFRTSVIEHWDLMLHAAVQRLASEDGAWAPDVSGGPPGSPFVSRSEAAWV
jgi:hypothetical protein